MKKYLSIAIKLAFVICTLVFLFRPESLGFQDDLFKRIFEILREFNLGTIEFWYSSATILMIIGFFAIILFCRIPTIIKVTFILGAFVLLFRPETFGFKEDLFENISLESLIETLKGLDPGTAAFWLSFAAVIKIAGIFAGIIRWRILLRAQGVHIPFWYLTKCWFWGRAIGLFLPGTLGLDAYRMVESSRYTGEVVKCTTVVVIEKLCGFIALFTLVFLTLPLGMRLFDFNQYLVPVLIIIAGFITVCLTLLFQPRIIQVIAGVLPVPKKIRDTIDKIGTAATAYSAHKLALIKALFFGFCVHLGICLMYFGTASAIRAENTDIFDILFASPLIIVGSVFAPTVSGMGVREVVMTTLLGGTAGVDKAFIFGHLGLWFGEVVPFLLSLPLLLFTTAPKRDELLEEAEAVREAARKGEEAIHLDPAVVAGYRAKVWTTVAAAILGGLAAGAFIGITEAAWLWHDLPSLTDYAMFVWGPITYGILFAGVGIGIAFGLLFLYLLFDRFAPWTISYALGFGGAFATGGLIIGIWRFKRDILGSQKGTTEEFAQVAAIILGIVFVLTAVTYIKAHFIGRFTNNRPTPLIILGILIWGIVIGVGTIAAKTLPIPIQEATGVEVSEPKESAPNIILIAVDTLRADFLKLYNENAVADTPNIDAFAEESVLFELSMSQASWTKPAFGTIFTGLYPETHRATTKTAMLPDGVETVAELLQQGGYHTQGFANNPNVSPIFNFDQGFNQYIYLKPSLYFWASDSAAKLSMYEVLRKVRMTVKGKISNKLPFLFKMNVKDYYQPGEVVTKQVLKWCDNSIPEDKPFYAYIHYMDPHDPFMDPKSKAGGYARSNNQHPDPELFTEPMRNAYISEIEHLDSAVGDLIAGLKSRGLFDDALVVFTADHGEEFQEHGGWWHGFTLYEEMTHIPMLLKLPDGAHAGTRNIDFARHIDLAPTFLHFAGLPKGKIMPGISLINDDGEFNNASIEFSYAENDFEGNRVFSIRDYSSKLITANKDNTSGLAPLESYELLDDPSEQNNLLEEPVWVLPFQDELNRFKEFTKQGAMAAETGVIDPLMEERMKSIGYF